MLRITIITLQISLVLVFASGLCLAETPAPQEEPTLSAKQASHLQTAPKAVFPERMHNFGEIFEGEKVKYDFVVENQGSAPLVIKDIRTS